MRRTVAFSFEDGPLRQVLECSGRDIHALILDAAEVPADFDGIPISGAFEEVPGSGDPPSGARS